MKVNFIIKTVISDVSLFLKSRSLNGDKVECPICNFSATEFGVSPNGERENVRCPRCSSLERHRAQWISGLSGYINSKDISKKRILHFSPDFCYARLFLKKYRNYFTAEYSSNSCSDYTLDIQDTGLQESSFDIIICNHILEHVSDDKKAINEIYRLLKPCGVAFVQVPLNIELKKTIADPSITNPEDRKKYFGQSDHLRMYGCDFPEKLSESGFQVDSVRFWESMSQENIARFSLHEKEPVFICRKPS